ncbi:hypothetical protein [Endozoicomonas sp. ONNA2]|uniref:A1S_2505 family phage non-structural protein n=1 Tax=Endozoicomonas sp. ONNA2 TaxID=2828741 RepID=UPI0021481A80|nr:hypothetical protein [Endozoicomonas sp. ONNA2]
MTNSTPIFVFGSNLAGFHGKGAALYARKHHGAEQYTGIGRTGNAYAIPTKDHRLKTLPLIDIRHYVNGFIAYANNHPDLEFKVNRIGCGLASYRDQDIAPMFQTALNNCRLPDG